MKHSDRSLLLSQLLDLHLSRTIEREYLKDHVMRKFVQLAEDIESDLKGLDRDADDLERRRLEVKEAARTVVNDHHRIQDRIEEGIAAMRRVSESAGLPNTRTRTAAELAEIAAEEERAKNAVKPPEGEKQDEVQSGEDSGDTPQDATFQPKPE